MGAVEERRCGTRSGVSGGSKILLGGEACRELCELRHGPRPRYNGLVQHGLENNSAELASSSSSQAELFEPV
jgi:hypothetical protein